MKTMKPAVIVLVVLSMALNVSGADKKQTQTTPPPKPSAPTSKGFTSITSSTTKVPPKQPGVDVAVCAKAGIGTSGKICIGTDGITTGMSAGQGVQIGGTSTKGWDGKTTTCSGISAGGGAKVYVTGGESICKKDGQMFEKKNVGVGAGPDGFGGAVYVDIKKKTPINAQPSPAPVKKK
ncbi:MAG: hypothetical protein NTY01_24090 [Verrucomicrobia bacterium]|nr:hypothetical protein [Verrucomicrobiota bacterium]